MLSTAEIKYDKDYVVLFPEASVLNLEKKDSFRVKYKLSGENANGIHTAFRIS